VPSWLALLVTTCFTLSALWLTLRAWQVRRTTPRGASLALSTAACVAILVVAADPDISLQSLCEHPLTRTTMAPLESDLEHALDSDWWRVRPCRHLQVRAEPDDLTTPVDFSRLAALAASAGVAVDITLGDEFAAPGEHLHLEHKTRGPLPIQIPIPASQTDLVRPVTAPLGVAEPPPVTCQIDRDADDTQHASPSLHDLLKTGGNTDYNGFHHLHCWEQHQHPDAGISTYIHISTPVVKVVTQARVEYPLDFSTAEASSLGPGEVQIVDAEPDETTASALDIDDVAMLVLDRPRRGESCNLARTALAAGKSVVVAMPDSTFLEPCSDLLPIRPGGRLDTDELPRFDRKPRITFVVDDFARDLDLAPSCIYHPDQPCDAWFPKKDKEFPTGLAVQGQAIRTLCDDLSGGVFRTPPDCGALTAASTSTGNVVIHGDLEREVPALPQRVPDDLRRLERSSPATPLRALRKLFDESTPPIYRENDLTVLFTFDPAVASTHSFADFLETGSRLHIVPIHDPYGTSLRNLFPDDPPLQSPLDPNSLVTDPARRATTAHATRPCGDFERCADESPPPPLDSPEQTGAELVARPRSRFVPPHQASSAAPARYLWLEPDNTKERPGAALVARTTRDGGLRERPLALGMMHGRGHLLLLNYSPFEWYVDDDERDWLHAPKTHQEVLGGYRLISNLYAKTSALLASAAETVRSVQLQPDGAVWITMSRPSDAAIPEQLIFSEYDPTRRDKRHIVAPLVDFDDTRGEYTYALPARELSTLPGCVALYHDLSDRRDPVYACPPSDAERSASSMDAARSLRMLARYTGGLELPAGALPRDVLRTRPFALAALSLILLAAWGRRAARRLFGMRTHRRLRHIEQVAQRRYDPPDAVVAAAGDWDGRSSTWPRTGAFGGYRPLEAGDRPTAIVLQDIVLPAQGGPQLLPRVMQRIEEAAPGVLVLVNLGESMRVPGRDHGKAVFAGHIALHVAAAAWKIRGEVEIHSVGVEGESEIVAPTRLSPGYEELDVNVRARLAQRPFRDQAPWPDDLPECGSVVYVSDFQLEDPRELQSWLTRLEGAGIRVGGVMVYSPLEFTMIEGGRLAGSGVWADRTDWDPDDVFAAFSRRRDVIEHIFDATTTGGLVVAGTQFSQDDVEVALESGRLLQILR